VTKNNGKKNQINYEKTTSLQKWDKIIGRYFNRRLRIERSKDREKIYRQLDEMGLPREQSVVFRFGCFPTKNNLKQAIEKLGRPYWISAVPNPEKDHLNRLSKLRIYGLKTGWKFVEKIRGKANYKIIISQYADNPTFKGSGLVSKCGKGIIEFITGDRHYILTRGFTETDPLLFNQEKIVRYSTTISREYQNKLVKLLNGNYGHFEFQYGTIKNHEELTFFDYNLEPAYLDIDRIWADLRKYFESTLGNNQIIKGLPASPGKATGRVITLHHEDFHMFNGVKKGDIIVSDTTTPEMTPVMKKAAGIITDLGGVTSHAAIVCRELGIPCIVGTKKATEILQTDQKVSINANKGLVTKL